MVWNTETFINDAIPTADDVKLNALNAEQESLVTTTGQTPNQTINDQMGKGAAILASGSVDQYTISGGPVAYVATPIAPVTPISPTSLFVGMRVRGIFPSTNAGGAMTMNVNGTGATPVKLINGTDPVIFDLNALLQVEMFYDGTNFVVTSGVASIINGGIPVASDSEMEAAAIDTVFVTPLNFIQSPSALKAEVLFDGTVGGSGAVQTILANLGISSVTRVGVAAGTYDVTFVTPFTSVNYFIRGSTGGLTPDATDNYLAHDIQSASICRVFSRTPAGGLENSESVSVSFSGEI